ncbi:hypothetical protein [Aureispira sp. CCB-QB1]|uniref:hypothetical protein n=1 Tax=Aureispira sp. CCB-QB1 TaxID=1313421 RepID=UPI00069610A7|nr:hypothetical protein [Aureispira sp. CCB-QB1]
MIKGIWKLVLLSLLAVLMFSSCKKEEPINSPSNRLHGEWNLMQYSAGLAGLENYNKDDVTWTFNSNGTVDVVINVALNNSHMPIQSNTTDTYIMNGTKVKLASIDYDYDISFDNGKLILSNSPAVDGPSILFERD